MLRVPVSQERLRVLAIDPGGVKMGLSMATWDMTNKNITIENAITVLAKSGPYPIAEESHHARLARLLNLSDQFTDHLRDFNPHVVVSESPFMAAFATAFKSLSEVLSRLQQDVYAFNPMIPFHYYAPMQVKQGIGVSLKRGEGREKEDNRNALFALTHLTWMVDRLGLDDNAIDSVAVAVTYLGEQYQCLPP